MNKLPVTCGLIPEPGSAFWTAPLRLRVYSFERLDARAQAPPSAENSDRFRSFRRDRRPHRIRPGSGRAKNQKKLARRRMDVRYGRAGIDSGQDGCRRRLRQRDGFKGSKGAGASLRKKLYAAIVFCGTKTSRAVRWRIGKGWRVKCGSGGVVVCHPWNAAAAAAGVAFGRYARRFGFACSGANGSVVVKQPSEVVAAPRYTTGRQSRCCRRCRRRHATLERFFFFFFVCLTASIFRTTFYFRLGFAYFISSTTFPINDDGLSECNGNVRRGLGCC